MNLTELGNYVCQKVRKTDSNSIAKCKEFLRQRDQMIWHHALWRESLYQIDVTYNVADALNAAGIYLLPRITDRVIAVRTADRALQIENQEVYFQQDFDAFARAGTPLDFHIMQRCVNIFPAAKAMYLHNDAADNGTPVFVRWIDENNEPQSGTFTLATAQGSGVSVGTALVILDVSKPGTTAAVTITDALTSFPTPGTTLVSIALGATNFTPYTPLRLVQKPSVNTAAKVLVKTKYQALTSDYDESELSPWVDNVLIAFAMGDMLERDRRYGQAKMKFEEGVVLLKDFKAQEATQSANAPRLIPEECWDPIGELNSKGYF